MRPSSNYSLDQWIFKDLLAPSTASHPPNTLAARPAQPPPPTPPSTQSPPSTPPSPPPPPPPLPPAKIHPLPPPLRYSGLNFVGRVYNTPRRRPIPIGTITAQSTDPTSNETMVTITRFDGSTFSLPAHEALHSTSKAPADPLRIPPPPADPRTIINREISKHFRKTPKARTTKAFRGKVTDVDVEIGSDLTIYEVIYRDGDTEWLYWEELAPLLLPVPPTSQPRRQPPAHTKCAQSRLRPELPPLPSRLHLPPPQLLPLGRVPLAYCRNQPHLLLCPLDNARSTPPHLRRYLTVLHEDGPQILTLPEVTQLRLHRNQPEPPHLPPPQLSRTPFQLPNPDLSDHRVFLRIDHPRFAAQPVSHSEGPPSDSFFYLTAQALNRSISPGTPHTASSLRRLLSEFVLRHPERLHSSDLPYILHDPPAAPRDLTSALAPFLLDPLVPAAWPHIAAFKLLFADSHPLFIWRPLRQPLCQQELEAPHDAPPTLPHAGNTWTCWRNYPVARTGRSPIHLLHFTPDEPLLLPAHEAPARPHGTSYVLLLDPPHQAALTTFTIIQSTLLHGRAHRRRPPPEPD